MKVPGWQVVIVVLAITIFLMLPAGANPIERTFVNYTIYQNNQPINDTIDLSLKCYGGYSDYRLVAMGLSKNRSTTNPELVYSYSLACEPNNCHREETYGATWGMTISSCDLEGMYKRQPFLVKNFTITPEPTCFTIARWNKNGIRRYYVLSSEDRDNCTKKYPSEGLDSERPFCYENYSHSINETAVIQNNPSVYCEKRFDIPYSNQTVPESVYSTQNSYLPKSPVESLYCSLLRVFGARC